MCVESFFGTGMFNIRGGRLLNSKGKVYRGKTEIVVDQSVLANRRCKLPNFGGCLGTEKTGKENCSLPQQILSAVLNTFTPKGLSNVADDGRQDSTLHSPSVVRLQLLRKP